MLSSYNLGFPGGSVGKNSTCQCRRLKRRGLDPWVRKIPWERAWQLTPVFLPGKSHEQRTLVGYSTVNEMLHITKKDTTINTMVGQKMNRQLTNKQALLKTHSSILAWRIPGTEEPSGLPSMGSHRVGHDWSDLAAAAASGWQETEWSNKRKWRAITSHHICCWCG